MTLSSILLNAPAETARPDAGAVACAIALAKAHGARLTALAFEYDVTSPTAEGDDSGSLAVEDRAARTAEAVRSAARSAGVDALVVTQHSHAHAVHDVVLEHARLHDLIVTGTDGRGLLSERMVAEHLLFESGRPLLLVPPEQRGFSAARPVVAWDGSRAAARALGDARMLIRGSVRLMTFADDKESAASLSGPDVEATLARRGLEARVIAAKRGPRAIADAINEEALALGADLLVMGGYGQSRWREAVLGGATRGMLAGPVLPTLIAH